MKLLSPNSGSRKRLLSQAAFLNSFLPLACHSQHPEFRDLYFEMSFVIQKYVIDWSGFSCLSERANILNLAGRGTII